MTETVQFRLFEGAAESHPLQSFGAERCMAHFESVATGERQRRWRLSARLTVLPLKPISGLLCQNPILLKGAS
jgi:hypothetical protein